MEVKDILHKWRKLKGISVYKLSKLSGVSENHIRNIENGKKQTTIKTLQALTDGLNMSLSEFFNTDNSDVIHLSESEKKMLSAYRRLPKDKADILIEFYERMREE